MGRGRGQVGAHRVLRRAGRRTAAALGAAWKPLARGRQDSIHDARIQVRRLRSILQVYAPLWRAAPAGRVSRSLRALGRELGRARDAEVMAQGAEALVDAAQVSDQAREALEQWVVAPAHERHARARAHLLRRMSSARSRRARKRIRRFFAHPPFTDHEDADAWPVVAPLLGVALDDVARAAREAVWTPPGPAPEPELHAVRKAARRVRYATEILRDAPGVPRLRRDLADRLEQRAHAVQDALGDHRDGLALATLVERGWARRAAGDSAAAATSPRADAGEPEASFAAVARTARERADRALLRYPGLLEQLESLRAEF